MGTVTSEDFRVARDSDSVSGTDFVVVTEDGVLHGFDLCASSVWTWAIGHTLVNATETPSDEGWSGARMIPAIDGSLYVVFQSDSSNEGNRIAHVNATIMSVVAESPFTTPAFPNAYLTGSKVQSLESVTFDASFTGWTQSSPSAHLFGRKLVFSINEWTLTSIDTSSQRQLWSLSFSELPSLTHAHLVHNSVEAARVSRLAQDLSLSSSKVKKRLSPSLCDGDSLRHLTFGSQVLGVYALLDPVDTGGHLSLVLVGKNSPIPTSFGGLELENFSNFLHLPGIQVDYSALPLEVSAITPYHPWPPAVRPSGYIAVPEERRLHEYRLVDFLHVKFFSLSWPMRMYVLVITCLALYLVHRLLDRARRLTAPAAHAETQGRASLSILLPDGTQLRQAVPETTLSISSPASSSNRLILIPSEAIQPYEVVRVGQGDSVEFEKFHSEAEIFSFEKKIKDISQRTAKLPFAHSASRRPSIENATVLFLGRNVDEPKLVFRNPRAESEQQRANIPIYTQSVRNAVASSALKDSPLFRAYVPRSVCGTWNSFQGIFQEFIPQTRGGVTVQSLRESPETAADAAVLIMLVRDTDAHDGNYVRDLRRKVALFDLGCALGDRPLPADANERHCLDNFEIYKRVPDLLDVGFAEKHIDYLESVDWGTVRAKWQDFKYQDHLVEQARLHNTELVHPQKMVRVMEVHANFLLACANHGRTILFAAHVMYSGLYDDVWLEEHGDIDCLEKRLVEIAGDSASQAPEMTLRVDSPTGCDDLMDLATTHGSIDIPVDGEKE